MGSESFDSTYVDQEKINILQRDEVHRVIWDDDKIPRVILLDNSTQWVVTDSRWQNTQVFRSRVTGIQLCHSYGHC